MAANGQIIAVPTAMASANKSFLPKSVIIIPLPQAALNVDVEGRRKWSPMRRLPDDDSLACPSLWIRDRPDAVLRSGLEAVASTLLHVKEEVSLAWI
jgi:hypothetical protein